jgi:large subunit ribosomal protein L30e
MMDVEKAIATTVKTGKVLFGTNKAVESVKMGRAKLIVLASNCPQNVVHDIKYYSRFSNVPVVIYKGTSIDLGAACGKPFVVSALTVREPGDSDILKLGEETKGEEVWEAGETAEETDA